MSDTPRTDTFLVEGGSYTYDALADFAARLERELAATTKERDEWKAKAEANERDAGRYRWIRSHVTESPSLMFESSNPEKHNDWRLAWMLPRIFCRTAVNSHIPFDDAIDAARGAENVHPKEPL